MEDELEEAGARDSPGVQPRSGVHQQVRIGVPEGELIVDSQDDQGSQAGDAPEAASGRLSRTVSQADERHGDGQAAGCEPRRRIAEAGQRHEHGRQQEPLAGGGQESADDPGQGE